MKTMPIRPNCEEWALIDDEDFDLVNQYKWFLHQKGYVDANAIVNGKRTRIKLHRLIMNFPKGKQIDHINGNKLDNRKSNLRICGNSNNQMNVKKKATYSNKPTSSIYKGVSYKKKNNKWQAYITKDQKRIYIGYFVNEKDAALAYNKKAMELFGEYANLNKV
jgi:hypothetical protein